MYPKRDTSNWISEDCLDNINAKDLELNELWDFEVLEKELTEVERKHNYVGKHRKED